MDVKIGHLGLFALGFFILVASAVLGVADRISFWDDFMYILIGLGFMWAGHDLKKPTRRARKKKEDPDPDEE